MEKSNGARPGERKPPRKKPFFGPRIGKAWIELLEGMLLILAFVMFRDFSDLHRYFATWSTLQREVMGLFPDFRGEVRCS